ncbi:MAG: glycosyltransferase [Candidatus Electrothrix sp. AW5]|nr:glycosyltransferase [Candidatus Electrothrix gigas]
MTLAPYFSIIIPSFNSSNTIDRAISSVFNQNCKESIEVIVVDDGSTDNSLTVIEKINDHRLNVIKQKNKGPSAARNLGTDVAKGNYVAFLDADDEYHPKFLSRIVYLIEKYPNAKVYTTGYWLKYDDDEVIPADIKLHFNDESTGIIQNYFYCAATGSNPICSSSICIKKHILSSLKGFPMDIRMHEDLYLWVKLVTNHVVAHHKKPSSTYYKNTPQSSCKRIIATKKDLRLVPEIYESIKNGKINGKERVYAISYANRWVFRDAFKSTIANEKANTKEILSLVKLQTSKDLLKLFSIYLLNLIPHSMATSIWASGRWIKSIARKHSNIQLTMD